MADTMAADGIAAAHTMITVPTAAGIAIAAEAAARDAIAAADRNDPAEAARYAEAAARYRDALRAARDAADGRRDPFRAARLEVFARDAGRAAGEAIAAAAYSRARRTV